MRPGERCSPVLSSGVWDACRLVVGGARESVSLSHDFGLVGERIARVLAAWRGQVAPYL